MEQIGNLPEKEEEKKTKKKTSETQTVVVAKLPTQEVSNGNIDGKDYEFITIENALTELIIGMRRLIKSVG